ncbi:MAG TPA: zf-HC2 domain-containing protein [Blastocatellia bacterium]|nr:zf-HC2 domain-containing protein [Blastocatellia bacterium]
MKYQAESHCGKQELLITYLYDEATKAERAEFERHLTDCAACSHELQALRGVREDLSTWQVPFVPHIEVVTPRTATDALRDFFRLVPRWFKITSGFATAAAAALIVFALAGTRISIGNTGVEAKFGVKEITQPIATGQPAAPQAANSITRAEAEQLIQAAVAQAQTQAQQQTQLQLAHLESKLTAAHQVQLQNASLRLRQEYQRQLRAELAKLDNGTRQSLTEWLLTTTDNGQEATSNEKNN